MLRHDPPGPTWSKASTPNQTWVMTYDMFCLSCGEEGAKERWSSTFQYITGSQGATIRAFQAHAGMNIPN